jgi:hypothetical protein
MGILDWFETTFNIYRHTWKIDESDNRYSEEESAGSFLGHKQQATQEKVAEYGLSFQTAFTIWCAVGEDVQLGDVLRSGGDVYTVKAIQTNDIGSNSHLEILVEGGATSAS